MAKWEELFNEMEREGVTILIPNFDPEELASGPPAREARA